MQPKTIVIQCKPSHICLFSSAKVVKAFAGCVSLCMLRTHIQCDAGATSLLPIASAKGTASATQCMDPGGTAGANALPCASASALKPGTSNLGALPGHWTSVQQSLRQTSAAAYVVPQCLLERTALQPSSQTRCIAIDTLNARTG